ncbi:ferredoxin III, nif-specific [Vulcanococcus limneticus]|uniref:ferredoxin III, nif-specific n=2 Tax=Vulcanococcus limneticus TaxID=2170428 RepID=UPI002FCD3302
MTLMTTQALTALTFGGNSWTPQFVQSIDQSLCIGCGRCFKSCGRSVLMLRCLDEEGQLIASDDEEDEEYERKVMTIAAQQHCIGCQSCLRACPKNCLSHAPLSL